MLNITGVGGKRYKLPEVTSLGVYALVSESKPYIFPQLLLVLCGIEITKDKNSLPIHFVRIKNGS
jgi:hypothetical protein